MSTERGLEDKTGEVRGILRRKRSIFAFQGVSTTVVHDKRYDEEWLSVKVQVQVQVQVREAATAVSRTPYGQLFCKEPQKVCAHRPHRTPRFP